MSSNIQSKANTAAVGAASSSGGASAGASGQQQQQRAGGQIVDVGAWNSNDKMHAQFDALAQQKHLSVKQREQLFEYERDAELTGGVFVGGKKMDSNAPVSK